MTRSPYDAWILTRGEREWEEQEEKRQHRHLECEEADIALDAVIDSTDPEVQQWAVAGLGAMNVLSGPSRQYPTKPPQKFSSTDWHEKSCSNATIAKYASRSTAVWGAAQGSVSGHFTGLSYSLLRRYHLMQVHLRRGGHIE